MRKQAFPAITALSFVLVLAGAVAAESTVLPAPNANGIELPAGYKNWRIIGVSHRTDNNSLRVILGNARAIAAVRAGETNPWPKGTNLAKIVLKDASHEQWPAATVPGKFVHAEFMPKDSTQYRATGG